MNPNRDIAFSRVIETNTTRFATVIASHERSCDVKTSAGAIMRRILVVDAVAGRIRTHDRVVIVLDEGNQEWICIGIILEESSTLRPVESGEVGDTHTHAQYALETHTHDIYALVAHSHDYSGVYAALAHDHDYGAVYAALAHAHAWADITSGLPDFATRWPAWGEVTDKPLTFAPETHTHDDLYFTETESDARFAPLVHTTAWADLTGVPATFAPSTHDHDDRYFTETESDVRFAPLIHSTAWADLTGVPSTFAPSSHSHAWADITSGVPDYATRWPTWSEVTSKPTTFVYTDVTNIFTAQQNLEGSPNAIFKMTASTTTNIAQIQFWENIATPALLGVFQVAGSTFPDSRAKQMALGAGSGGDVVLAPNSQTFNVPFVVKGTTGYHTLVGQGAADLGQLSVKTNAAGTKGIVVDTPATPSANLLELKANTAVQFAINQAGQIWTNQAAATSGGTDQPSATAPYRMPVYNASGTLLGYVPIYSTWT